MMGVPILIKCHQMEIDEGIPTQLMIYGIENIDDLAHQIAAGFDPGLLITEDNQTLFLDAMDLKFIKQYVRDRES